MTPQVKAQVLRAITTALLLCALIATYRVYQPGLSGAFVFDDHPNIVANARIAIGSLQPDALRGAALSGDSGPLGRPLSMLSFALNYYSTGLAPYYFKLTNLAIHLVNGISIFVLSLLILSAYRTRFQPDLSSASIRAIALAVCAAWLLHPFNLTSVLYVVQRMNSLSALFVLWGLILFVWARIRLLEGRSGIAVILISLLLFTPLSALGKETGALMPLFMLVLEISLFQFQAARPASRKFLLGFFGLTVALPGLLVSAYLISHLGWLQASYAGREFTLEQRLLTEPRILWFYLRQIALPDITGMGLFHDDIPLSQGLLAPLTTLPAIMGLGALMLAAWFARRRAPLVTLGLLFFLCGHILESTVFSLEIVHEHRNYLPMFGILLPMFYYLMQPLQSRDTLRLRQAAALLLIALFAYDTWARALTWSNPFDLAKSEVEHHPNSARDNGEMADNYVTVKTSDPGLNEFYYQQARHYYEQSTAVDPNYSNGLFGLILLNAARGKDLDPRWIDELEHRLRFSRVGSDVGDKLIQLVNCQTENKCHLDPRRLERLIRGTLDNPSTQAGRKRALVRSSLSYYQVNIEKNYPLALETMRQTVTEAPEQLQYRLTLIQFLTVLGHTEEARRELETFKQLDRMHAYAEQISVQEKSLSESSSGKQP